MQSTGVQAYFANITSQSEKLEREKQKAESVSELSRARWDLATQNLTQSFLVYAGS
jgi:hypothetical protein